MTSNIVKQIEEAVETENLLAFIREYLEVNGNLSIRGVAGMCGVSHTSIIRGGAFKSAKLAQRLEPQGFEAGALSVNGFPPVAVWLTIKYFAKESKAAAPWAEAVLDTFGAYGIKKAFKLAAKVEQQQLPKRDAIDYIEAQQKLELMEDSILTRLLRDRLIDELSLQNNNLTLPGTKTRYTIVKVRATELGYTAKEIGSGSQLGKFVKRRVEPEFQEQIGRYLAWHYAVTEELDNAIHDYFNR